MTIERDMERANERIEALVRVASLLIDAIEGIPCIVGDECERENGYGDEYRCRFHRVARDARRATP